MSVVLMLQGEDFYFFTLFSGNIYLSNAFCCFGCLVISWNTFIATYEKKTEKNPRA